MIQKTLDNAVQGGGIIEVSYRQGEKGMKKRFATTLASVLLASVMCVGFAACGDDSAGGDPAKEAENLVGEEVNKATWDAALSEEVFQNVKLECEMIEKSNGAGYEYIGKEVYTYIYVNQKSYINLTFTENVSGIVPDGMDIQEETKLVEGYIDRTQDPEKVIIKSGGQWKSGSSMPNAWDYNDRAVVEDVLKCTDYVSQTLNGMPSLSYEDFTYSAEKKGYVGNIYSEIIIKFKDGKVKAVKSLTIDGSEMQVAMLFTFGGQIVTLPEIA